MNASTPSPSPTQKREVVPSLESQAQTVLRQKIRTKNTLKIALVPFWMTKKMSQTPTIASHQKAMTFESHLIPRP